jgi:hypothetical protein
VSTDAPAAFIGSHELHWAGVRCGVVETGERHLTVCSGWNDVRRFGWRVERIENSWRAAREWLGY